MNSELSTLRRLPWIAQRAQFKKIAKQDPDFRSLRRHTELLRLLISGLSAFLFYSLKDQFGLMSFVGWVVTNLLVDLWMDRVLVLRFAILYLKDLPKES